MECYLVRINSNHAVNKKFAKDEAYRYDDATAIINRLSDMF